MLKALAIGIASIWVALAPIEVTVTEATLNDNLTLTTEYGYDIHMMGEQAGDWLVNLDRCPEVMTIGESYDVVFVNGNVFGIAEVER